MTVVVVAEKPSVARDIAKVLGANERKEGFLEGGGYRVTWAVGHLVGIADPKEMDSRWEKWSLDTLPMLPKEWKLVVRSSETKKQFQVVKKLLTAKGTKSIVCATDAGREGELIFRYIYEAAGCTKPWERLWISSLTEDAIRNGFRALRPGRDFDGLGAAALARSRADWLVGMNLTRHYGLTSGQKVTVGRVQTPTLAMVVARELAIAKFVPEPYLELEGEFLCEGKGRWIGTLKRSRDGEWSERFMCPAEEAEAQERLARAVASGKGVVLEVQRKTRTEPPPQLYDLTELQRDANRLFGLTATETLEIAQALYEKHKVLSYPRTDSRFLSPDVEEELRPLAARLAEGQEKLAAHREAFRRPLGPRFVNAAKVSDHHAIVPVRELRGGASADEARIFDLVLRRTLAAWLPAAEKAGTQVVVECGGEQFFASGSSVEVAGWLVLVAKGAKEDGATEEDERMLPAGIVKGDSVAVERMEAKAKKTKPPKRFTEATLLTAMEQAGGKVEEKELAAAMKGRGIGTPATRAAIIENLVARGYMRRAKKALEATPEGVELVRMVDQRITSPRLTGEWEARMAQIEDDPGFFDEFMGQVETFVVEVLSGAPRMARLA